MGATSPESLSSAGGFLIAAGVVAALTGGLYGLQAFRPGLVVLAVLLAMGYGAAGHLLLSRRSAALAPASALAAGLTVATLFLFQAGVADLFGVAFTHLILFPALAALLAFAAAHLVAFSLARRNARVKWPRRAHDAVASLLQVAALGPIVGVFLLAHFDPARSIGTPEASVNVVLGMLAGIACATGGVIASVRRHPRFTLVGGSVGFLANTVLLFAFASLGPRAYLGQLVSLAGLLLAAYPVVASALAWAEAEAQNRESGGVTPESSEVRERAP